MDEDDTQTRHIIGINAFSLEEGDATVPSAEEIALGDLGLADVLKSLSTDRQKFIALALYQGWNKSEIAIILKVDPSDIAHITKRMQITLATYRVRYKAS
jgi:DNA-directed RNA polymerase specialized sigma24 family protein